MTYTDEFGRARGAVGVMQSPEKRFSIHSHIWPDNYGEEEREAEARKAKDGGLNSVD